MVKDKLTIKRDERLAILRVNLEEYFATQETSRLNFINTNTGNPTACVFALAGDYIKRGVVHWFDDKDINQLRQNFYVSASLIRHYYEILNYEELEQRKNNCFISQWELLAPLVSNRRSLVDWYAHNDKLYDLEKVERHKSWDFVAYQSMVALRGEWDRLIARCELAFSDPPTDRTWYDYHALYYALAQKDKAEMERQLQVMLNPVKLRVRLSEEPPYTEHLFVSRIIIFMKIAWLHGFDIGVDSPYVPMEWMPTQPLETYSKHYSFLDHTID